MLPTHVAVRRSRGFDRPELHRLLRHMLLTIEREECLVDDLIVIDEPLRNFIAETEVEVKRRLSKLRSRLDGATTQIAFDFSPFMDAAERYLNALGVLKDRPAIGRDDPQLAIVLESKPLGRHASNAASYLMTHATTLESRTRHDLLSDLWLVNLAHELSETLQASVETQASPASKR